MSDYTTSMPRSHKRSSQGQVAPDRLIFARRKAAFSVDVPPGEAEQTYPLIAGRGQTSIFDVVKPVLKLSDEGYDMPTLVFGDHKIYGLTPDGEVRPAQGQKTSSLFTVTSKMSTLSLSLPAGPTKEGGSCSAANFGARGGKRTEGKSYICDECYSLEGRYVYYNIAIGQAAHKWWVEDMIRQDSTGAKLGGKLLAAITDFARNGSMDGMRGGLSSRVVIELGVWRDGQLCVPWKHPVSGDVSLFPAEVTKLPLALTGVNSTRELFAQRGARDGEVCGFFRIHDSGDINIGRSSRSWAAYINAWVRVAQALPNVFFWLPTRAWIFPPVRKLLIAATQQAPNLVIRASALNVGDPAPNIPGLPAGTTVARKSGTREFVKPPSGGRGGPELCPVGTNWVYDPEKVYRRKKGAWVTPLSCQLAGCRACWLAQIVEYAYGEH